MRGQRLLCIHLTASVHLFGFGFKPPRPSESVWLDRVSQEGFRGHHSWLAAQMRKAVVAQYC